MVPVSVVVPCFRSSATIERALRSVAAQSVLPREVIVVDDASGDDTADRVERIGASLALPMPLKVLRQPDNRGAGEARNAGWDAATGDYVAFLDSDDAWHPGKIEVQYRFMQAHREFGITGHGHRIVLDAGNASPPRLGVGHKVLRRRDLLVSNRFVTPSVMVRAGLPLRFAAGKRHMEDHHLWALAACEGVGIARLRIAGRSPRRVATFPSSAMRMRRCGRVSRCSSGAAATTRRS